MRWSVPASTCRFLSSTEHSISPPCLLARTIPYIVHYANTLREKHFQTVAPTYVAFKALVDEQMRSHKPKHRWGPPLPREEWAEAERRWLFICVRPQARKQFKADDDWHARTFNIWEDYRYRGNGQAEY